LGQRDHPGFQFNLIATQAHLPAPQFIENSYAAFGVTHAIGLESPRFGNRVVATGVPRRSKYGDLY